jgi:hypothetical protein
MTSLIWWTSLLLEAGGLVFAKPGPVPSEYMTLRQLVIDEAQNALPEPIPGEPKHAGTDAWETIARLGSIVDDVNAEVRQRFQRPVRDGVDDDGIAFSPEALLGRPGPDTDPMERDAAFLGMSLLETRGFFDALNGLIPASPGVCLDPSERSDALACRRMMIVRQISKVLSARMELAARASEYPQYMRCVEQHLALARIAGFQIGTVAPVLRPNSLSQLVRSVQNDVVLGRIPSEYYTELGAILQRQVRTPSPRLWILADASALRVYIASTHTDDGHGNGRLLLSELLRVSLTTGATRGLINEPGADFDLLDWSTENPFGNAFGVFFATRKESAAIAHDLTDRLLMLSKQPYTRQQSGVIDLHDWAAALPRRDTAVRMWALTTSENAEALFRAEADTSMVVAGARTMLAIEAYRTAKRRLPESLSDLVPEFISALPNDPYGDGPLIYKPTDPTAPAPGTGYLLYSLWEDGADNSGARSSVRTQIFTPPRSRLNVDYLVNDMRDTQSGR